MKIVTAFVILSVSCLSFVYAEDQHDHDSHSSHEEKHDKSHQHLSEKDAIQKGIKLIQKLASKGDLDKTWAIVSKAETIEEVTYQGKEVWRIAFVNMSAKKSKQRLYAYISVEGKIIGANFKKLGKEEHEGHEHH